MRYFEINVSLNGLHFFATAERSLTTRSQMQRAFDIFAEKFPISEGYEITITEWDAKGRQVRLPRREHRCMTFSKDGHRCVKEEGHRTAHQWKWPEV